MDEAQPPQSAAVAPAQAGETERPQQQQVTERTAATATTTTASSSQAPQEQNDNMDVDPPLPPPPPTDTATATEGAQPPPSQREETEDETAQAPVASTTSQRNSSTSASAAPTPAGTDVAPSMTATMTATTTATPASPPLPARPTAVAPGPRAARLQKVLDDSLRHTLGKVGYDNFASCFPTVAARAPATLKAAQRQMVDRLGMLCKKEFASILESRNVVAKLNELEGLVSEAERRRDEAGPVDEEDLPIPPHLLPADAVLAAHLHPHLAASQSQLNARLQTMQAHNARLWADVRRQRADLAALAAALDRLVRDLDDAGAMLDDAHVDALARETRDVEAELLAAATLTTTTGTGGGGDQRQHQAQNQGS